MAVTQPIEDLYPVQPQIVNHDVLHCSVAGVKGDYLYSGRALGMTTPYDIIQLHPDLMTEFASVSRHYQRMGLSHTDQIIWNLDFAETRHYPRYELSCFYFGEAQHRAARNENWYRVVDFINSKNNFAQLAQQFGMAVPVTHCFNNITEIDARVIAGLRYPCFAKAAISVAGLGIYRCATEKALREILSYYGPSTPIQIQEEVRASTFLNLQYQVSGSRLERLAISEQILEGYQHRGNRFPTPHNAWHCVEPMAKWLFSHGMRGIFAFDVAVVKDGCGIEYIPIECNPRFNAASYPTLIAKKLAIPRWQTRTFRTRLRTLANLSLADIEYNPADQSGVILVNWGTVLTGSLVFLLAGSPVQQQALRQELERRL